MRERFRSFARPLALLYSGLSSCGGSPTATVPTTQAASAATTEKSTTSSAESAAPLLYKVATASTRELALTELAPELALFVFGPDWAPLLEHASFAGTNWSTWLVDNHVVHQEPTTNLLAATLTRAHVEKALDEFSSCALPVQHLALPTAWQTTVLPALAAERVWLVCQRKRLLLAATCDHPTPLNERLAVAGLVSELALEPLLAEGIPVRPNGEVAWMLDVRVVSQSQGGNTGVAGVPLYVASGDVSAAATASPHDTLLTLPVSSPSDAQGWAHFPVTSSTLPLRVTISPRSLLGPFAQLTELPHVLVQTRPLDFTRLALVDVRAPGGSAPGRLSATLGRELSLVYGKPLPQLSAALTEDLERTVVTGTTGAAVFPAPLRTRIVEASRGTVDYIALVATETEFASQMGADRTWYEARARAHVIELWSGQVVAQFEEGATGSGFGDAAAETAAQLAVVQKLRTRLQAWRAP